MTLIVSLLNCEKAVLLADRRISADGQTLDDGYNKVCVYCGHDARIVFAFTGIATFQGFDTSTWLMRELHELGESRIDKLFDVLEAIRKRERDCDFHEGSP